MILSFQKYRGQRWLEMAMHGIGAERNDEVVCNNDRYYN
jgi:hypothetical protein